jgi:hypothetical protein
MRSDAPYEAYRLFMALRLHFTSDYDAVKYNFKSSASPNAFYKRRDKYFFAKIAKQHERDIKNFYVSQFINGTTWVGDMLDEEGARNYRKFRKIKEAIHRTFELDMQKASEHVEQFDDLLTVKEFNQPPLIIKLWQQEEINLESVVILNNIFGFMNNANKDITETISWPDIYRLITKITPFVEYRPDKATTILQSIFYK